MIRNIFRKSIRRILMRVGVILKNLDDEIALETLPEFGNSPKNLNIALPRTISNPEHIFIGDDVWLGPGSFLTAHKEYPRGIFKRDEYQDERQLFNPRIDIGDRVSATGSLMIAAFESIVIENDVMFATNTYISDGAHGYRNPKIPFKYQPIINIKPVRIEKGCWIGQNVVILPGVTIGEYSIIGANSVVTKSIPARSIAAGVPANIIKRWDDNYQDWISEDTDM